MYQIDYSFTHGRFGSCFSDYRIDVEIEFSYEKPDPDVGFRGAVTPERVHVTGVMRADGSEVPIRDDWVDFLSHIAWQAVGGSDDWEERAFLSVGDDEGYFE